MPMKMYVFDDAKVAGTLRSLGFSVIQNGRGKNGKYCVPENQALLEVIHTQFSDVGFTVTDVLCF